MPGWFHGINALLATIGSVITVAGSALGILVAVGVINVGGDDEQENRPPSVGSITLASSTPQAGQPVRAEVIVSDPERDRLEIRWLADVGDFTEGNAGSSVIYRPPETGASFQLTVEVTDGLNPPVTVSRNFRIGEDTTVVLPTDTPPPGFGPKGQTTPTDTPAPQPPAQDISGIWSNPTGFLEITRVFGDQYSYTDHDNFGNPVGEGRATLEDGTVFLEGAGLLADGFGGFVTIAYTGDLELVTPDFMQGDLFDPFGGYVGSVAFTRE